MSKIVPKLNLNKNPQAVENNSLVYARNIKLLHDGSLVSDGCYKEILKLSDLRKAIIVKYKDISFNSIEFDYLGAVVGLDNKIYFFVKIRAFYTIEDGVEKPIDIITTQTPNSKKIIVCDGDKCSIEFPPISQSVTYYEILEYNEISEEIKVLKANWTWHGGAISGVVTNNATDNKILTVCETKGDNDENVPIKHIPIVFYDVENYSTDLKIEEDETLYTQTPNIPFIQLSYVKNNNNVIASGVYQFFIRYKTKSNLYTNWFVASKEIYTGSVNLIPTIQGGVSYTEERNNSFGFTLSPEVLFREHLSNYSEYQIGCIISTNDSSVARIWKSFDITDRINEYIDFFYNSGELEETNIDDMLASVYEINNVGNIDVLDNRLYIANYDETKHNNTTLQDFASSKIELSVIEENENYDTYDDGGSDKYQLKKEMLLEPGSVYYFSNDTTYTSVMFDLYENENGKPYIEWKDYAKIPSWRRVNADIPNGFINRLAFFDDTILYVTNTYKNSFCFCLECINKNGEFKYLVPKISKVNDGFEIEVLPDYIYNSEKKALSYLYKTSLRTSQWNDYGVYNTNDYNDLDSFFDYLFNKNADKIKIYKKVPEGFFQPIQYDIYRTPTGLFFKNDDDDDYFLSNIRYLEIITWDFKSVEPAQLITELYEPDANNTDIYDLGFKSSNDYKKYTKKLMRSVSYNILTYSSYEAYNKNISEFINIRTLLPYVSYNCYVHFVKPNGVSTNGYFVGQITHVLSQDNKDKIVQIIPTFKIKDTIEDYTCVYFSVQDISSTRFLDLVKIKENCNNYYALEINASLYKNVSNLKTIDGDECVLESGYNIETFGSIDSIHFNEFTETNHKYVCENDVVERDDKTLIRITPYIKIEKDTEYNKKDDLNLPGFITYNALPSLTLTRNYYVVDLEITRIVNNITKDIEIPVYNTYSQAIIKYSKWNTTLVNIIGGLNKTRFKTWQIEKGTKTDTIKTIINTINSQEVSTFLSLSSIYYDFIKPIYTTYNEKDKIYTRFDNVVRRSNVYDLENKYFSYKFDATDYYCVPNDKGNIVYLFSSGNMLLIHLEETLVKFDVKNMISSNNTDLSLEEGDAFKQGIVYVKDSKHGFAGLYNKLDTLVTSDIYMFFDKIANRIYSYDGNTLHDISAGIIKILELIKPSYIRFVYDYNVNRILINLVKVYNNQQNKNLCLSYSLVSNAFTSLHDIFFSHPIITRSNSYIRADKDTGLFWYKIDGNKTLGVTIPNNLYNQCDYLDIEDYTSQTAIIDVICNSEYEVVKVLDYIQWVCKSDTKYDAEDSDLNIEDWNLLSRIVVSEPQGELYCGNKIRIYSDQTYTPLLTLTNEYQDAYGVEEQPMGGYQDPSTSPNEVFPRNNNGVWTLNDFRDVKQIKTTQIGNIDNSLIHGKYFIARFIFDGTYFKLENIKFNIKNYEKV